MKITRSAVLYFVLGFCELQAPEGCDKHSLGSIQVGNSHQVTTECATTSGHHLQEELEQQHDQKCCLGSRCRDSQVRKLV